MRRAAESPEPADERTGELDDADHGRESAGGDDERADVEAQKSAPNADANGSASPERPTAPATPDEDPAFQAVVAQAGRVASDQRRHDPAASMAAQAQNAAVPPANDVSSRAKGRQVGEMGAAPTPDFDEAAFRNALMARIEAIAPRTEEEADDLTKSNKLGGVKTALAGDVEARTDATQRPIEGAAEQTPDESGIKPKKVERLREPAIGAPPAPITASGAAPKPRSRGEVERPIEQGARSLDARMADAQVTEEQLERGNEPAFQAALAAKREAQAHAATAPAAFRGEEAAQLAQAGAAATETVNANTAGMYETRSGILASVANQQRGAKGKDEQARAKIAGDLEAIYSSSRTRVEAILGALDAAVDSTFDSGAARAQQQFEAHVEREMAAYKQRRYGDSFLSWNRVRDAVLGLPDEVDAFYRAGRRLYLDAMDGVIDRIVALVGDKLREAKVEVRKGQREVARYVEGLPLDLRAIGNEAAAGIQGKLDELGQQVNAKKDQLIETLAARYADSVESMDARIDQMKAENDGLLEAALGSLGGVFETILELEDKLLSVLSKASDAIEAIIADPIGFLQNLAAGVVQGLQSFVGNIGTHLQTALVQWLTGALGPIQIPDDVFSIKGVFSLVTQVLGLTYDRIRAKAVKLFGEPVVAAVEKGAELFEVLRTGGPEALWEHVAQELSDLKDIVLGGIKDLLIAQVIQAGVKWLIGLMTPASAFVKAVLTIVDIVKFFVEKASQIAALVEAFADAVLAIASGSVGAVAAAIENALARALPVVIGFLANLLGLGGLASEVRGVIDKIQDRVDKAIDKVLHKVVGPFKRGKGKRGEAEPDAAESGPEHDAKVRAGLAAIDDAERAVVKDSKIAKRDAEAIARRVKRNHPVFESLVVVDGGGTWDYRYRASPEGTKKGEEKLKIPTGDSSGDPIPIALFKVDSIYRPIELEDYSGEKTTYQPFSPRPLPTPSMRTNPSSVGARAVRPPDGDKGIKIGVSRRPSQLVGKVVKRVVSPARRTEAIFKRALAARGWSWTGYAPDHIHDLALGGRDVVPNLWPLDSGTNRAANATYWQKVTVLEGGKPQEESVSSLGSKWLKITELKSPG